MGGGCGDCVFPCSKAFVRLFTENNNGGKVVLSRHGCFAAYNAVVCVLRRKYAILRGKFEKRLLLIGICVILKMPNNLIDSLYRLHRHRCILIFLYSEKLLGDN